MYALGIMRGKGAFFMKKYRLMIFVLAALCLMAIAAVSAAEEMGSGELNAYNAASCEGKHTWRLDVLVPWPEDPAEFHGNPCMYCDEIAEIREHTQDCTNPGVCRHCGGASSNWVIHENLDTSKYVVDPDNPGVHGYYCSACNKLDNSSARSHSVSCANPGVCVDCGYKDGGMIVSHQWVWEYVQYPNEPDKHGYRCSACGEFQSLDTHSADCTDPGVCRKCGAEWEDILTFHKLDNAQEVPVPDQPGFHGEQCTACGEYLYLDEHSATCANPNICKDCGAPYAGEDVAHQKDKSSMKFDDKNHWYACLNCNEQLNKSDHYTVCNEPGVCARCGYEGDIERFSHTRADDYQYNQEMHWTYCKDCGKEFDSEPHFVDCFDQTMTCTGCGMPGAAQAHVDHPKAGEYQYDADGHWQYCPDCRQNVHQDIHFALCTEEPGVCIVCGYADEDMELAHESSGDETVYKGDNTHWWFCESCGDRLEYNHYDKDGDNRCDYCQWEMSGNSPSLPPVTAPVLPGDQTVYLTKKGYGAAVEIAVTNPDAGLGFGALTAASSNAAVVKVENMLETDPVSIFRLTGLKAGKATITVTTPRGKKASMQVNVQKAQQEMILPENEQLVIRDEAFIGLSAAEFVYLPSGITAVGDRAFKDCLNLKRIYIPDTVTAIGEDAFVGCDSLMICTPRDSAAHAYAIENSIAGIAE